MLSNLDRIYLRHRPSEALEKLYFSISMRQFAVSMIAIFEPVYLYKAYGSIGTVLLFYVVVYGIYFFMIPLGGKIVARRGVERSIADSMICIIFYYLALGGISEYPTMIYVAALFSIADKTFLRVAYHADMARNGVENHRGREVGMMSLLETAAGTLGPVVGGLVLAFAGFKVLLGLVAAIALLSVLPMVKTRAIQMEEDFSPKRAFADFIHPSGNLKRRDSLAFMGYGEEIVSAVLWPIFIFMALPDYHIVGLISTGSLILVIIFRLYMGKLADVLGADRKRIWVHVNSAAYALVQFLRYAAGGIWSIFAINFASDALKSGITYPCFTYVYSAAGKNEGFLGYVVFYEMSLALGRVVLGASLLLISCYFAGSSFWFIIFLFAALWSWLYTLLKF